MQIQLIGQKGDFKRMEISREVFLSSVSNASVKSDFNKIVQNAQSKLKQSEINFSNTSFSQLGRDGNAFYISIQLTIGEGTNKKRITGLGALTLINALPLNVVIYESSGTTESRDHLPVLIKSSLTSLLTEN